MLNLSWHSRLDCSGLTLPQCLADHTAGGASVNSASRRSAAQKTLVRRVSAGGSGVSRRTRQRADEAPPFVDLGTLTQANGCTIELQLGGDERF